MKKAISVLLSILFVVGLFAFPSSAADCAHQYELQVVVEPTCHSTGAKGEKCVFCGDVKEDTYEAIPATDHVLPSNNSDWNVTVYPTTESDGERWCYCADEECDAIITETMPALTSDCSHPFFSEPTVIEEATCSRQSKSEVICLSCGAHKLRYGPALEHTWVEVAEKPATCEKMGKTGAWKCLYCHIWKDGIAPKITAALGHSFYVLPDVEVATCTAAGTGHQYCSNEGCDYVERVSIPRLEHQDHNGDGKCEVCGNRLCTCICHQGNFISFIVRWLNTMLNNLMHDGEMEFACCDCMEPV